MDKHKKELNHIEYGESLAEGLAAGIENRCPSTEQALVAAADEIYDKAVADINIKDFIIGSDLIWLSIKRNL